jgi:hypothetical protein
VLTAHSADTLSSFVDAQGRTGQRLDPMSPLTDQLDAHVGRGGAAVGADDTDYQASDGAATSASGGPQARRAFGVEPAGRVAMVRAWPVRRRGRTARGRRAGRSGPASRSSDTSSHAAKAALRARSAGRSGRADLPLTCARRSSGWAGDLGQKLDSLKAELARRLEAEGGRRSAGERRWPDDLPARSGRPLRRVGARRQRAFRQRLCGTARRARSGASAILPGRRRSGSNASTR